MHHGGIFRIIATVRSSPAVRARSGPKINVDLDPRRYWGVVSPSAGEYTDRPSSQSDPPARGWLTLVMGEIPDG